MSKQPSYHERLWPNIYLWLFAILMLGAISVAAGNVYGYDTAVLIFIGCVAATILSVLTTTVAVEIRDGLFVAGRAKLPIEFVGEIRVLDKTETARARARDAHPDAYFTIRSWIPESVIVVVTDESDPHPYWHVSSRDSRSLANALELAKSSKE